MRRARKGEALREVGGLGGGVLATSPYVHSMAPHRWSSIVTLVDAPIGSAFEKVESNK